MGCKFCLHSDGTTRGDWSGIRNYEARRTMLREFLAFLADFNINQTKFLVSYALLTNYVLG